MSVSTLLLALANIPSSPGVYRMVDAAGKDLYIGKAKNLYKRVASYTYAGRLSHRLRQMVHHLAQVHVVTTASELDALLLEANLIQQYRPPYNILLKEGNPFSYLVLTDHPYPRLEGQRRPAQRNPCFGPFLRASSLKKMKEWIHQSFLLRSCSDFTFSHRSRPCLEYDLKRCSAPCVKKVSQEDYRIQVQQALRFLRGDKEKLCQEFLVRMEDLSARFHYEQAGKVRDQWKALRQMSGGQMDGKLAHGDVIALSHRENVTCLHLECFRHGSLYAVENFFFHATDPLDGLEIVATFIQKFYGQQAPPSRLVLPFSLAEQENLRLLFQHRFGKVPHFVVPKREPSWLRKVKEQGDLTLANYVARLSVHSLALQDVQSLLHLPHLPQRIEVYDNSHYQGECAVGVMVVANTQGFCKREYHRTFSMKGQDDCAMMAEVMRRRLAKPWPRPDLMLIDGGKGQLSAVKKELAGIAGIATRSTGSVPVNLPFHLRRRSIDDNRKICLLGNRIDGATERDRFWPSWELFYVLPSYFLNVGRLWQGIQPLQASPFAAGTPYSSQMRHRQMAKAF